MSQPPAAAVAQAEAPAPSEEPPAPEPSKAAKQGPFAERNAKRAGKKKDPAAQAPSAAPLAPVSSGRKNAPTVAEQAHAPAAALPGVDELLGREPRATIDLEPPVSDPAPPVFAPTGIEGAPWLEASCVPLTSRVFDIAWDPEGDKSAEQYLDSLLTVTKGRSFMPDAEMKAEVLERVLQRCVASGGLNLYSGSSTCARSMRIAISVAWEKAEMAEAQHAEEERQGKAETLKAERSSRESKSGKGAALGAAIAAAGLASGGGRRTADEDADDGEREADVGRARVKAVAEDSRARELLVQLRKRGEAVMSNQDASDLESFLKEQADAQVGKASIAELLHTSNLPTPKGVYADTDATICMLTGEEGSEEGEQLARSASVARDAAVVQKALLHALEVRIERKLKSGDAGRLAKAILYGVVVPVSHTTGQFKPKEMSAERSLTLFVSDAKYPQEAKNVIENMADALSAGLRIAHPHDRSIEDTLSDLKAASSGPLGDRVYHNQVHGETFKQYGKLWKAWETGAGSVLPTLASAWMKAQRQPRLIELLAGRTEMEQQLKEALERVAKAEAEAKANASKNTARRQQIPGGGALAPYAGANPNANPNADASKLSHTRQPGETAPVFKISGKERNAFRREHLDPLYPKLKAAKAAASAAEAAGEADAADKRAAVGAIEKAMEAAKAKLAEKP